MTWLDHYIDDFFTVGDPGSSECARNVGIMRRVFAEANLPTEPDKDKGPATVINFLGIELDTNKLEVCLPPEKLAQLKISLEKWQGWKACKKRELLSLIGSLNHACKAVRAGRSFLRRLIDTSTAAKQLNQFVRLTVSARSDIAWWHHYSALWNGTSMMFTVDKAKPQGNISIVSDASGSWGCGALYGPRWLQIKWAGLGPVKEQNITVKELLPIVVAAAVWGPHWEGRTIRAQCDNIAATPTQGESQKPCTSCVVWHSWKPSTPTSLPRTFKGGKMC